MKDFGDVRETLQRPSGCISLRPFAGPQTAPDTANRRRCAAWRRLPNGRYRTRTCDFILVRDALWPTELIARPNPVQGGGTVRRRAIVVPTPSLNKTPLVEPWEKGVAVEVARDPRPANAGGPWQSTTAQLGALERRQLPSARGMVPQCRFERRLSPGTGRCTSAPPPAALLRRRLQANTGTAKHRNRLGPMADGRLTRHDSGYTLIAHRLRGRAVW